MDMTNIWNEKNKKPEDPKEQIVEPDLEEEAIEGEVIEDLSEYAVVDRSEEEMPGSMDTKPESELDVDQLDSDDTYEGIVGVGSLGGRPSKLEPITINKLNQALKIGLSQKKAAVYAGISETTFYRWRQRAFEIDDACGGNPELIKDADDLELWEFWESIKKARVEGEINHLAVITEAANNGVWQASAWFLERSNPREWGKRSADELEAQKKKAITFNIKYSS